MTLYLSDLDGTLLRSDETVSAFTAETVNRLVSEGMIFSYATARSLYTAKKVTAGLSVNLPVIVYNGAFIMESASFKRLASNTFSADEAGEIFSVLRSCKIFPIVYSLVGGAEKFSYIPQKCTEGMKSFLLTRKGDVRDNPVTGESELIKGECFYFTCIDNSEKLYPAYEKLRDSFTCVYSEDIYGSGQWLEIMPLSATKAKAAKQLKELLSCDKIVAFGDGANDISLFEAADIGFAVENADKKLKAAASGIIPSNDSDGVARWLLENFTQKRSR